MRSHVAHTVALWCCLTAILPAHQETRSIPAGTASIAGRVMDRDSGRPLESVMMTLIAVDGTGSPPAHVIMLLTSGEGMAVLKTLTDANGQYVFEGLAPGAYRMMASHDTYISQLYDTSDMDVGGDDIVRVTQGQARRGLDFSLTRGGMITGLVTNAQGEPVKDASVTAVLAVDDGSFRFAGLTQARTDDRGAYTIRNLPAGSYRVSARWIDRKVLKSNAGANVYTTFFPGTDKSSEAPAVRVGPGETVRNIDIPLSTPPERIAVTGQVVRGSSDGRIEANLVSAGFVRSVVIRADDAFEIGALPPGRYIFWTRAETADGYEAAWTSLDVAFDMAGVVLTMTPTGGISGRIVTSDGSPLLGDGLQVAAILADEGKEIDPLPRDRVDARSDGSFDLRGLFGERILRVIGLSSDWEVDRIMNSKTAVQTFSVAPGDQIHDVLIVLRKRGR